VCVRNDESHDKRVYLNIAADRFENELIERKILNETQTYMQDRMGGISLKLIHVVKHQIRQRMAYSIDSINALNTNDYIVFYSIAQICVTIVCAFFQVYFIRRLFEEPGAGRGSSGRGARTKL
jgi:hypothetical protein